MAAALIITSEIGIVVDLVHQCHADRIIDDSDQHNNGKAAHPKLAGAENTPDACSETGNTVLFV